MLPLDSERWAELNHAYRLATDVPGWIQEIESGKSITGFSDFWSALFHQYTVYNATFATVPHLLRISEKLPTKKQVDLIIFIGLVATFSESDDDEFVDRDIWQWYETAIQKAGEIATTLFLNPKMNRADKYALLQAIAGLKGSSEAGRALERFPDGIVTIYCPACLKFSAFHGREDGVPSEAPDFPITTFDFEQGIEIELPTTEVRPLPELLPYWNGKNYDPTNAYMWLINLADMVGHKTLVVCLRHLYGTVRCTFCQHRFRFINQM